MGDVYRHIFYNNSTKLITWSTNGLVDDSIKTEQANAGLAYLSKDTEVIPSDNDFWINSDGTDIVEKSKTFLHNQIKAQVLTYLRILKFKTLELALNLKTTHAT